MSSQHLTTTGISFLHTLGTSGFIVDAVEDAGDVDQSLRQPLLVESVTPPGSGQWSNGECPQELPLHRRPVHENSCQRSIRILKETFRIHGLTFIALYISLYLFTLGVVFMGIESGLMDPVGMAHWIARRNRRDNDESTSQDAETTIELIMRWFEHRGCHGHWVTLLESHPSMANLVFALIAVKLTEPARLGFTLMLLPVLQRVWGRNGTVAATPVV